MECNVSMFLFRFVNTAYTYLAYRFILCVSFKLGSGQLIASSTTSLMSEILHVRAEVDQGKAGTGMRKVMSWPLNTFL